MTCVHHTLPVPILGSSCTNLLLPLDHLYLLHVPPTSNVLIVTSIFILFSQSHPSSIQSLPLPPTQTITPPPLPTTSPPQTQEDKNAIYEARYPQDLSGLSVADVSRLLRYLGLKDYVEKFENELIDGTMLTTLDRESLQSLNVQQFHCNKLLRFIGGWRPNV